MELHGTIWNYMELHGTIWNYMNYMDLHRTTYMELNIWNYIYGTTYMELHGTNMDYMELY